MKNNPLTSVVMSVYNGEKYLSEAIESVLNQTDKDFEFIIINDGSIDKSLEIIERYTAYDIRIVLINRENKGLVYSLNEGVSIAKGEYIARMDADDICLPTRFEEQINYMNNNNLCLCGSWIEAFNEADVVDIWKYPESHKDNVFRLFFMSSFAHPSVMMRKNVFKELKYKNEVAEDYRLWCDIVNKGFNIGNIQKVLLKYRIHENQITQLKSKELVDSSNIIGLNFAEIIDREVFKLLEGLIEIQNNNNISKFEKLLKKLLVASQKYSVSKDNLKIITKAVYNKSSPKNPLIYYSYFKATKGIKRNIKEEFRFFIKSLIVVGKESFIYQSFKKNK
jgi:glycosyltransferase involved in cell wall biosynthesis